MFCRYLVFSAPFVEKTSVYFVSELSMNLGIGENEIRDYSF